MTTLFAIIMTSLVHLIPLPVMEPGEGFFTLNDQTQFFPFKRLLLAKGAALCILQLQPSMGIDPAFQKSRPDANAILFHSTGPCRQKGIHFRLTII